jgi:hypothetical protein
VSRGSQVDWEDVLREFYSEVPAPPGGLAAGREAMLAEAARLESQVSDHGIAAVELGRAAIPRRRRKMSLLLYKVLAVVLAAAVALAGMGGGVVLAADSLPGDVLYGVKLLSEDVRLALTPDPADRAELALAFVSLRVQEMARLAQRGEDVPGAVVTRLTRQMEQAMVEIARAQPEEAPSLLQRVVERTQMHQQVLENAAVCAGQEAATRLREASQVMERTRQSAESDPLYLEYQNQHRYEGTAGPHAGESPSAGAGQQTQEQNQYSYEGTPGPHGEASPEPVQDKQRTQEEDQQRFEGTPGPHGEASATPTATGSLDPGGTAGAQTGSERMREEEQQRQEGESGSPNDEQGPPTGAPQPTPGPKGGGEPRDGH